MRGELETWYLVGMRSAFVILTCLMAICASYGQEKPIPLLLNGTAVRGEIVAVRPDGMQVQSGVNTRFYPWTAFAPGTRYRFDPLYRANLTAAQQGLAVARWPNAPDGDYANDPPKFEPASAPVPDSAGIKPLVFAEFPPLPARPLASLVTLDTKAGARSLAWGLRHGPAETDAAYFILETSGADGLPPAMHVWVATIKRAERVLASRRADGDEARAVFREQRFRGTREDVQVDYRISVSASTRMPGALLLSADIELRKGAAASSFTLVGMPAGVLVGDGNVAARDLLSPPSILFALDLRDGKPVYAGSVRMGRLRLIPRSGMERTIAITIRDERGKKVRAESIAFTGDAPTDKHSFFMPLDSLTSGGKYTIDARIDLGPFLGALEYQESFVMK